MMQGDAYRMAIEIKDSAGNIVTNEGVSNVEITVGPLTKTFADGDVTYDGGMWYFPFSQEETFKLLPSVLKVQARVLWDNGDVKGVSLGEIRIYESISKAVL